jgi:hypothetical protein
MKKLVDMLQIKIVYIYGFWGDFVVVLAIHGYWLA